MKYVAALVLSALLPLAANAAEVRSEKHQVSIARVVQVVNFSQPDAAVQVNLAVEDTGGSTDVSPTQSIYLNLYRKGEMYDVEASFAVARALYYRHAIRVAEGIYDVTFQSAEQEDQYGDVTVRIDARHALARITKLTCGEDFGCDASNNFSSHISVVRK